MKGMKFDGDKIDWTIIPFKALAWVAKVLLYGAIKYSRGNYEFVENGRQRYLQALIRHTLDLSDGEIIDEESQLPHLGCIGANVLILLWFWIKDGCPGYDEEKFQAVLEARRKEFSDDAQS